MAEKKIHWTNQQKRAITIRGSDVLVTASAGTGPEDSSVIHLIPGSKAADESLNAARLRQTVFSQIPATGQQ